LFIRFFADVNLIIVISSVLPGRKHNIPMVMTRKQRVMNTTTAAVLRLN
jgi:hypothetical protein